ncbi:hypothetical protein BN137_3882 [Cronobacter condimenti 1330]|uniref:Uncharacterized protein n=1 Tax=Cronobacter condimenti 1330 TaxID=1073999 RepID=K8AFB7_9ENTR|nr:hypothetical protein BN137_3882 [Cronobacter condimenti 1330]
MNTRFHKPYRDGCAPCATTVQRALAGRLFRASRIPVKTSPSKINVKTKH